MISGNIIDTALNLVIYELREHGRDATLPMWSIVHHMDNVSAYVSMIVASAWFIVGTTNLSSLMTPYQLRSYVLAVVIKEHILTIKDTMMSPTLAVKIMEWLYIYMVTVHTSL